MAETSTTNQGRMSHVPLSSAILSGFNISTSSSARLLPGGEGTTYLLPEPVNIVLKPTRDSKETQVICNILSQLNPSNPQFRISHPIRSTSETGTTFVYQNWSASTYIPNVRSLSQPQGEYTISRIREIVTASRAFHASLRNVTLSSSDRSYIKHGVNHVWAMSHRTVWSSNSDSNPQTLLSPFAPEPAKDPSHPYIQLVRRLLNIASYLGHGPTQNQHLYETSSQIIHGDIVGGDNVLFDTSFPAISNPPVIIDLSPTLAPESYAEGILLADVMIWCPNHTSLELLDLDVIGGATHMNLDMLRRGLMFRLFSDIGLIERGHEAAKPDIVESDRVTGLLEEYLGVVVSEV